MATAHAGIAPDWFESRSFTISIMLHLALLLLAVFGLPALLPQRPEPVPLVMTVEVLPISAMTNIKPSEQPITPKKEAPTPVKMPTPPAAKAAPTPPPPPPAAAEKVEPKPFDPTEGAEKKPPEKEVAKEEKPKTDDDLQKLLANLKAEAEKTEKKAKDTATTPENKTKSDAPYDASLPLSISEQDAIRNQFIPCWSPPMGAKDAANLVVILEAQYKEDGSLVDVKIKPELEDRYASDAFFKAAADSAIRAVHRCTPLKNLDMSKYGAWREMELTFDPKMYF